MTQLELSKNIEWTGEYNAKIKGEEYFQADKISIRFSNAKIVIAKARGVKTYTTTLEWGTSDIEELEMIASCSCPAYKRHFEPCKHVWGLIRSTETNDEKNENFISTIDDYENDEEIYLLPHSESAKYGHLSITSYQNNLNLKLDDSLRPTPQDKAPEPWKKDLSNLERYISDAKEEEDYESEIVASVNALLFYELEPYSGIQIYSNYKFLNISFHEANILKTGYGKLSKRSFNNKNLSLREKGKDAKYLGLLKGHLNYDYTKYAHEAAVPSNLASLVLAELVKSNRLFTYSSDYEKGSDIIPLTQGFGVFQFSANIAKDRGHWILGGVFKNASVSLDAQSCTLSTDLSYIVHDYKIYPTDLGKLRTHCEYLIGHGNIVIPEDKKDELKKLIKNTIGLEQTLLDTEFGIEKKILKGIPKIELVINERKEKNILGQLKFLYDSELHTPLSKKEIFNDASINDLFFLKNKVFEKEIINFLESSDETTNIEHQEFFTFEVDFEGLNKFVADSSLLGIEVRTQGYKVKHFHSSSVQVSGKNDWFELKGNIHFDKDNGISIPDIIKKKTFDKNFLLLGDGTIGIRPHIWLNKLQKLSEISVKEDNRLKFNRAQSIILDLLLEGSEVKRDKEFEQTVAKLRSFKGVESVSISKRFQGELRDYQESGINWLNFLHQFQIGGCLADDMGLGKTIQVLAHLQKIKYNKDPYCKGQHIIVVPKSLVYNWQAEAAKFTPDLRVLIYEGNKRESLIKEFENFDLIIMTYAVMRKDIQILNKIEFSYAVLDEAQYIKNTTTLVAKAAYNIQSKYKLALTGTPVENHIGELFSIFRFLIPNILPKGYSQGKIKSNEESMKVILRGLMPFILRRTKTEVLKDLPEKIETILYCEFEKKQEKIYNEMKTFYQKSLTKKVDDDSIKKSKIQILEALLRMRQISCHPGLVNKDYLELDSSKMITLFENIESLIERGEKILIFSQFTSFLAIIKEKLIQKNIGHAYLDGKTRNRQEVVNNFKTKDELPVFLISLKAGGVGLNLTEASYCFIVDPWWNPAVEAQAIDRIHRIGQNKKVFAYRLITKGSVEEKIIKLQQSKRELSNDILATDESLLKQMSTEDLQFLFS